MINSEKLFSLHSTANKISLDDREFGFQRGHQRLDNQRSENEYHWDSLLRSYSNMGSPTLHSFWTMIAT